MTPLPRHTIACSKTECDPPRTVRWTPKGRPERSVDLPGCPVGYPDVATQAVERKDQAS